MPARRHTRRVHVMIVAVALAGGACAAGAAPASAGINPLKPVCGVAGWVSGIAGKACGVLQHGDKLLKAGKKLATGHLGAAVKTALGSGGASSKASMAVGLAAVGAWVAVGAKAALDETAKAIGHTTSPQLGSTWFSSTYWRMTTLAAILTLPFLFAAAVQALMRSDLALLARAALGYLPLAMLAVSIAAPVTMLLLAASDQMSAIVASAGRNGGVRFLRGVGGDFGVISVLDHSPFLAFLVAFFTTAGALVLWFELLMRQAAVYVVVLMLPLAFSAMVWPARRIWAIRAVELLVALILAKFAIVAVLSLAGAALGQRGTGGAGGMLTGMVLVTLGAFAPWALLRLLPLTELASSAAGHLRSESRAAGTHGAAADSGAATATEWAGFVAAGMRREADESSKAAAADGARAELTKLPSGGGTAAGGGGERGGGERGRDVEDEEIADMVPAGVGGVGAVAGTGAAGNGSVDSGAVSTNGSGPARDASSAAGTVSTSDPGPWRPANQSDGGLTLGSERLPPPETWAPLAEGEAFEATGEEHDPLPPEQDPEDGRL
jgi:hypothetical protein